MKLGLVAKHLKRNQRKNNMELTEKQLKELEKLAEEVSKEAKKVVKDYKDNPSDMSGSITQVNMHSPILKDKNAD